MVEIKISYDGDLHCTAIHTPSGKTIITDAPEDNKGKGQSFSPTDLLATSLGVCYLTTMGIAAQDRNIELKGATCRVEKHMSEDKPRRVAKLLVELIFPEGIPLSARALLEAVALHCPVSKSIHPDIDVDLRLHFPDGQNIEMHTHS